MSEHMKEKFPEVTTEFYFSKRKNYVHTELDSPLFFYTRHDQITDEINSFMSGELAEKFKILFPQLVATVKWKYNYIIFQKKLILKKKKNFFLLVILF